MPRLSAAADQERYPTEMNTDDMRRLILESASEAQALLHELHALDPDNDTFTQVGLLDGSKTVSGYLDHNEFGVALDHVLYMIHESDIRYDADRVRKLHDLADTLNINNHYTSANLRRLGVTNAFNVPDDA